MEALIEAFYEEVAYGEEGAETTLEENFNEADTDQDGQVTFQELEVFEENFPLITLKQLRRGLSC